MRETNELTFLALSFLFAIGTAIGSFANVLIDRLSNEESIGGRSHCDYCKHMLAWYDLVPVFSFLFLGGRCRYCQRKLSLQYPLLEMLCGILFVTVSVLYFRQAGYDGSAWYWVRLGLLLGMITCFHVVFFADVKYQIIPDEMQIALAVLGSAWIMTGPLSWTQAGWVVGGVVAVTIPIFILHFLTRGKGMGFGDVKLAANIGLIMGIRNGLLSLYFGFITGAVIGLLIMVVRKKGIKSRIAFGPFLVIGMAITLLFAPQIARFLQTYYGL